MTPFRFNDERTCKLVELYRSEPCLWNRERRKKHLRDQAYRRLEAGMRELAGPNESFLSLKNLKTKIKNLRTGYHRELKKFRADPNYTTKLVWFDVIHDILSDVVDRSKDGSDEMSSDDSDSKVKFVPPMKRLKVNLVRMKCDRAPKVKKEEKRLQVNLVRLKSLNQLSPKRESSIDLCRTLKKEPLLVQQTPPLRLLTPPKGNTQIPMLAMSSTLNTTPVPAQRTCIAGSGVVNKPTTAVCGERMTCHPPSEDEFHFFGLSVAAQLRSMPLSNALLVQLKIQQVLSTERRQISNT